MDDKYFIADGVDCFGSSLTVALTCKQPRGVLDDCWGFLYTLSHAATIGGLTRVCTQITVTRVQLYQVSHRGSLNKCTHSLVHSREEVDTTLSPYAPPPPAVNSLACLFICFSQVECEIVTLF